METTNGQVRITGYLDADTHRRLRVLAAERGVRVTVLLREMVARGLDREETIETGSGEGCRCE